MINPGIITNRLNMRFVAYMTVNRLTTIAAVDTGQEAWSSKLLNEKTRSPALKNEKNRMEMFADFSIPDGFSVWLDRMWEKC